MANKGGAIMRLMRCAMIGNASMGLNFRLPSLMMGNAGYFQTRLFSERPLNERRKELEAAAAHKREEQLNPYSPWQLKIGRALIKFFRLQEKGGANTWYARAIYSKCNMPAAENREFFYGACQLPNTFQSWFSITQLHVWLVTMRLRGELVGAFPQQQQGSTPTPAPQQLELQARLGSDVSRLVVEYFVSDMETRLHQLGSSSSSTMKVLMSQHHGCSLAYDEGIYDRDPVLASALWRNLTDCLGGAEQVALLVQYVRSQAQMLDNVSSKDFLHGEFNWRPPLLTIED